MKIKNKQSQEQGFAHLLAILLIVGVLAGLGTVAYTRYAIKSKQLNSAESSPSTAPAELKPMSTSLDGVLSSDQISSIAQSEKTDSEVSKVGIVGTESGHVFHVEFKDGTSIDFNAKTGKRTKTVHIENSNEGTDLPAHFRPVISIEKARSVAQSVFPSRSVVRIQLESKDGTPVYDVRFDNKARVDVDTRTGAVIRTRLPNGTVQKNEPQKSTSRTGQEGSKTTGTESTPSSTEPQHVESHESEHTTTSGEASSSSGETESHGGDSGQSGSGSGGSTTSGGSTSGRH